MTVPQIRAALVAIGEQPRTARELADDRPLALPRCAHPVPRSALMLGA
jgi:hypothetical protein